MFFPWRLGEIDKFQFVEIDIFPTTQGVDLFPSTYDTNGISTHVETVCLLAKV